MRIMGLDEVRRGSFQAANTNLPAGPEKLNWRISQRGNPYAIVDGFHTVVFRRQTGQWSFRIEEIETEETWYSECRYSTKDAACASAG
jgi:hypothetical protein